MGIDPDKFYSMEQNDFWLALRGWENQLKYEEEILRHHAAVIISRCSMSDKPINMDKLWPMRGRGPRQISPRILEKLRKLKEADGIKDTDRGGDQRPEEGA